MKFLIDADCPRSLGAALQSAGHTVLDIRDINPQATDAEIYVLIQEKSFILLTRDTDFSNILRYPVPANAGIILLRLHLLSVEEINQLVLKAISRAQEKTFFGSLTVISRQRYRTHRF